jgi:hypothetical protein
MINLPVAFRDALESGSVFDIELYEVHIPNMTLYLCSCDINIQFNGNTYLALPIRRGEINKTVDSSIDSCELEISNATDKFTQLLFKGIPFTGSRIYIYRILYPESLANNRLIKPVFMGRVDSPELSSDGIFKVTVTSDVPNVRGGRRTQYSCTSVFGDASCKAIVKQMTPTITNIQQTNNGYEVTLNTTVSEQDYTNGVLIVEGEARKIVGFITNKTIKLEYPLLQATNFLLNKQCTIQAGCDKTPSDCKRHNNQKRYAGFLSVPFEFTVRT